MMTKGFSASEEVKCNRSSPCTRQTRPDWDAPSLCTRRTPLPLELWRRRQRTEYFNCKERVCGLRWGGVCVCVWYVRFDICSHFLFLQSSWVNEEDDWYIVHCTTTCHTNSSINFVSFCSRTPSDQRCNEQPREEYFAVSNILVRHRCE